MKKKILIVVCLVVVAILVIGGVFAVAVYQSNKQAEEIIVGEKIVEPDRIVYRNEDGEYFEFFKDGDKYEEIMDLLTKSITSYEKDGQILKDEDIEHVRMKNCIEFDYKTVSKNYIIQLEKNDGQAVIKLADVGELCFLRRLEM